ncbi:DUF7660 family protein [Ectopseudomonas khazarica]|uniref:DUF7660 family protein n=1 Tax=Ectopseudomonas khazarica TaxID=2502979 RepID=UPI0037CBBAE9
MNDKASEIAPTIQTREDFQQFLALLAEDYRANGQEWESTDIGSFLAALISYSKDIDGYYKNTNQQVDASAPSWRVFAEMLCGARVYEYP